MNFLGRGNCQPLSCGQVSVCFLDREKRAYELIGFEMRELMSKARSLQGYRAPAGCGDHLKREGGTDVG